MLPEGRERLFKSRQPLSVHRQTRCERFPVVEPLTPVLHQHRERLVECRAPRSALAHDRCSLRARLAAFAAVRSAHWASRDEKADRPLPVGRPLRGHRAHPHRICRPQIEANQLHVGPHGTRERHPIPPFTRNLPHVACSTLRGGRVRMRRSGEIASLRAPGGGGVEGKLRGLCRSTRTGGRRDVDPDVLVDAREGGAPPSLEAEAGQGATHADRDLGAQARGAEAERA